jgi:hypothetical protein
VKCRVGRVCSFQMNYSCLHLSFLLQKDWREKRDEFKKKVRRIVRKSQEMLWREDHLGSLTSAAIGAVIHHQSPNAHLMPAFRLLPCIFFHSVSLVWWCWVSWAGNSGMLLILKIWLYYYVARSGCWKCFEHDATWSWFSSWTSS